MSAAPTVKLRELHSEMLRAKEEWIVVDKARPSLGVMRDDPVTYELAVLVWQKSKAEALRAWKRAAKAYGTELYSEAGEDALTAARSADGYAHHETNGFY